MARPVSTTYTFGITTDKSCTRMIGTAIALLLLVATACELIHTSKLSTRWSAIALKSFAMRPQRAGRIVWVVPFVATALAPSRDTHGG